MEVTGPSLAGIVDIRDVIHRSHVLDRLASETFSSLRRIVPGRPAVSHDDMIPSTAGTCDTPPWRISFMGRGSSLSFGFHANLRVSGGTSDIR
jgi:hypothetical protein